MKAAIYDVSSAKSVLLILFLLGDRQKLKKPKTGKLPLVYKLNVGFWILRSWMIIALVFSVCGIALGLCNIKTPII